MKEYRFCAYPFLYDDGEDLKCDYEIFTDEITSRIGLLRALIKDEALRDELTKTGELMYHMNSSLRTRTGVYEEELQWLNECYKRYKKEMKGRYERFVLPQGCVAAAEAHIIRSCCKKLVRLIHRHSENGNEVDPILFEFANLFSDYFFLLALKLNAMEGIEEIQFVSRSY